MKEVHQNGDNCTENCHLVGGGGVNGPFNSRKLRFTAPLSRRRKTKFATTQPTIYTSIPNFECNYLVNIAKLTMNGHQHVEKITRIPKSSIII